MYVRSVPEQNRGGERNLPSYTGSIEAPSKLIKSDIAEYVVRLVVLVYRVIFACTSFTDRKHVPTFCNNFEAAQHDGLTGSTPPLLCTAYLAAVERRHFHEPSELLLIRHSAESFHATINEEDENGQGKKTK